MAQQLIDIDALIDAPVERVFAHLAEHEHLGPLFGARIARVRDGDEERNGVGSVRAVRVGPLPAFDETVTAYETNARIEYRITRGGVLRDHHGCMLFTPDGTGTRLHYTIRFEGKVPGLGVLVRIGLERTLRRALASLQVPA